MDLSYPSLVTLVMTLTGLPNKLCGPGKLQYLTHSCRGTVLFYAESRSYSLLYVQLTKRHEIFTRPISRAAYHSQ